MSRILEGTVSIRGYAMFSNTAHGYGRLKIGPSVLQLRLGPLTGAFLGAVLGMDRVIVHRHGEVDVYCAFLGPPPMFHSNTGVVLRSGLLGPSAVVVVKAWHRAHVIDSLVEAGFDVTRRPTFMKVGYGAIRRDARNRAGGRS